MDLWVFDIILIIIFAINVNDVAHYKKARNKEKHNNPDISMKCFFNNLEKQLSSLARLSSTLMYIDFSYGGLKT